MVEIVVPSIEEILLAFQAEEPTDREIWIIQNFGGDF